MIFVMLLISMLIIWEFVLIIIIWVLLLVFFCGKLNCRWVLMIVIILFCKLMIFSMWWDDLGIGVIFVKCNIFCICIMLILYVLFVRWKVIYWIIGLLSVWVCIELVIIICYENRKIGVVIDLLIGYLM